MEGGLIAVSLVDKDDKDAIRDLEEKTQQCRKESRSNDFTLIDCKKKVAVISFWNTN